MEIYKIIHARGANTGSATEIIEWLLKNDKEISQYILTKKKQVFWKEGLSKRAIQI